MDDPGDRHPGEWPHLAGSLGPHGHRLPVRIYYEDTDFSGVVYHASYLRFMERGRTDYLRLLGANHRDLFADAAGPVTGFAFVVRTLNVEFLKPAHIDDVLVVETRAADVKGASVTLRQRIVRGADRLIDATVRVAFVAGGRARRIPDGLRKVLAADASGAGA